MSAFRDDQTEAGVELVALQQIAVPLLPLPDFEVLSQKLDTASDCGGVGLGESRTRLSDSLIEAGFRRFAP